MFRLLSHAEQLAAHLRGELLRGQWQGEMPGVAKLEAELGVNHTTINQALVLLEEEGLLVSQGEKRRRQIVLPKGSMPVGMRVGFFMYEQADHSSADVCKLRHRMLEEGFLLTIPEKTLVDLAMKVEKVARLVRAHEVDAWVVAGASSDVLRWFCNQPVPFIAFAGQYRLDDKFAAVSPGRTESFQAVIRRLTSLGHRLIVFLSGSGVKPKAIIAEMEAQGIPVGPYHMPAMERSAEGLRKCLDSLYAITPPTALIIDEAFICLSAQNELAKRGIFAPRDVSLVCTDYHPIFDWYRPTVAHARWKMEPIIQRIMQWLTDVSRGKQDQKAVYTQTVFVDGGTVGPVGR